MTASLREEAARILARAQRKGIDQSLEPVKALLSEMGDPDRRFESLQIVGTNGKSSTARYAAALLRGEGFHVGLYVSPMLERYEDQIEIDGSVIDEDTLGQAVIDVSCASERINAQRSRDNVCPYPFTEFELLTVAAIVVFARSNVEVAVFEAGLGGRWDATSAVRSIRTVAVTGIGLDHTRILGSTLEEIAGEKASVMQEGRACVLGAGTAHPKNVQSILLKRAEQVGVTPVLVRETLDEPVVHLHPSATFEITTHPTRLGDSLRLCVHTPRASYEGIEVHKPTYQAQNIACALALVEEHLQRALSYDCVCVSAAGCSTPGRFELLRENPLVLIDACHNPQSIEVFLNAVRSIEADVKRRPTLLCAVLADKDVEGMVKLLAREFPKVVVTQTNSARALPAHELATWFESYGNKPTGVYENVESAVKALKNEAFVACGSITTAGEVKAYFRVH